MLTRLLEPELMDTAEDAAEYDAMDHSVVNSIFVSDLLAALSRWPDDQPQPGTIRLLDLGTGTAHIPIELARRSRGIKIMGVDAATEMLALGRRNVAGERLGNAIELLAANARDLPFDDGSFDVMMSNSIIHHISQPEAVLAEAVRVTAPGGLLFHRDLRRPEDETELDRLVQLHSAGASNHQRQLFAQSLRAALTLEEMRGAVVQLGHAAETVKATSDRHSTWTAWKAP